MSSTLTSKFEDVYPLTPFQQGVLFHVLDSPNAGMYLNQQRYTLRGEIDLPAFKNALQAVMNRYQIFRTAFLLSGLKGPHQVVYRRVNPPLTMLRLERVFHCRDSSATGGISAFRLRGGI